jgi:hypothetical protein
VREGGDLCWVRRQRPVLDRMAERLQQARRDVWECVRACM